MNFNDAIFTSWKVSNMIESDPERAKLITACLRYRHELSRNGASWVPFPQGITAFTFGKHASRLPIGALFLLWDRGEPFVSICPSCNGKLYTFGFGGGFFGGGMSAVCTGCNKRFFRSTHQNIGTLFELLKEPLEGTAFYVSHMELNHVFPGQRQYLWKALKTCRAEELPSSEWATAFEPLAILSRIDPERGWTVKTLLELAPREPKSNSDTKNRGKYDQNSN
jgi:hypothetical protein